MVVLDDVAANRVSAADASILPERRTRASLLWREEKPIRSLRD